MTGSATSFSRRKFVENPVRRNPFYLKLEQRHARYDQAVAPEHDGDQARDEVEGGAEVAAERQPVLATDKRQRDQHLEARQQATRRL